MHFQIRKWLLCFNDVAVAAKYLKNKYKFEKILILDLDVHQGDGTAKIFENDDSFLL